MRYVCFHYEFEHDPADRDEEYQAGGCPSFRLDAPSPLRDTSGQGPRASAIMSQPAVPQVAGHESCIKP
jgi:hypothetical protein